MHDVSGAEVKEQLLMIYPQTQPGRSSALQTATTIAQLLVTISGLTAVILGLLFWTGNALTLIPIHMVVGLVLVLSLWTLAVLGIRAGVHPGFVALAIVWGLIVPALGATQTQLLPGGAHWVIRVLHLIVGLVAMALGHQLASRIRQAHAPTHQV
jgi:hypothetical protein